MPGRLIAVGDIHGCHKEFADLLDKLDLGKDDRLILLGDLAGDLAQTRHRGLAHEVADHAVVLVEVASADIALCGDRVKIELHGRFLVYPRRSRTLAKRSPRPQDRGDRRRDH